MSAAELALRMDAGREGAFQRFARAALACVILLAVLAAAFALRVYVYVPLP